MSDLLRDAKLFIEINSDFLTAIIVILMMTLVLGYKIYGFQEAQERSKAVFVISPPILLIVLLAITAISSI